MIKPYFIMYSRRSSSLYDRQLIKIVIRIYAINSYPTHITAGCLYNKLRFYLLNMHYFISKPTI